MAAMLANIVEGAQFTGLTPDANKPNLINISQREHGSSMVVIAACFAAVWFTGRAGSAFSLDAVTRAFSDAYQKVYCARVQLHRKISGPSSEPAAPTLSALKAHCSFDQ